MEVTMAEPQQQSSEPKSYTIIRVKRKLTADGTTATDRFNSFKRLRHIGSFADKQNEETIAASNLLKQLGAVTDGTGELTPKRIKFNDLNSEQLEAYVERLDKKFKRSISNSNTNNNNNIIENEKNIDTDLKKSTENKNNAVSTNDIQESSTITTTTNLEVEKTNDNNSIFDIELSPDDIGDSRVKDNETDSANLSTITCNDSVLELVPSETNAERYVYDYYVLMDNLIDFEHNPDEKSTDCYYDEGEDADSNDENYRYNDYPDEDEFEDHSDEDYYDVEDKLSNYSEEDLIRDEDGNVLFVRGASLHHHRANSDDEDYFDESDDYADFCGTFDKLKFKSDSDIDGGDDDSD